MISLLFYGYATGVFSSRKIEKATYDSVAFRFISANTHPAHDTIATFRKRFLQQLKPLFVEILMLASEMGLLKLGKVSLDGTKVKANASKHHALSWDYASKLEQQLKTEVDKLLRLAEQADSEEIPEGMDIPEELCRRQDRLDAIALAKMKIEERAAQRYAQEQKEHEEKVAKRQAKAKTTGKKPRGREPKPPTPGPRKNDQVNLTDEESRIMPSSEGFVQAYNGQVAVDVDTMIIVESHISQAPNDKQEIDPTLAFLDTLPEKMGKIDTLLADAGYYSDYNVTSCEQSGMEPYKGLKNVKEQSNLNIFWLRPVANCLTGDDCYQIDRTFRCNCYVKVHGVASKSDGLLDSFRFSAIWAKNLLLPTPAISQTSAAVLPEFSYKILTFGKSLSLIACGERLAQRLRYNNY